jgi:hypothetical protein
MTERRLPPVSLTGAGPTTYSQVICEHQQRERKPFWRNDGEYFHRASTFHVQQEQAPPKATRDFDRRHPPVWLGSSCLIFAPPSTMRLLLTLLVVLASRVRFLFREFQAEGVYAVVLLAM